MTVILERVRVLSIILEGEYTLDQLLKKANLPQDTARKHIEALTNLGLIEKLHDGQYCIVEESRTKISHLVEQYR